MNVLEMPIYEIQPMYMAVLTILVIIQKSFSKDVFHYNMSDVL